MRLLHLPDNEYQTYFYDLHILLSKFTEATLQLQSNG